MISNSKTQKKTIEHEKSEHKSEHTRARSKANLSYWDSAIFQRRAGGNWWVQIQHAARREKFSLSTPVKAAAAARARDMYQTLVVKGWDEALREFKPQKTSPEVVSGVSTVGEFLDELKAKADLSPTTLEGYAVALRKIVSDAFEIDTAGKLDNYSGGYQRWLKRVHAIKLAALTSDVIQRWKRAHLARAGDDPIKLRSAKISFNSYVRRAKSLFTSKAIKHLSIQPVSPFENISFEARQSMRYRSTIDVEKLTRAAHEELALADSPAFLVFLLALGAGLRRIEIDRLEWSAMRFDENVIRIEPTQHFDVKTEHSIGDVPVDAALMNVFRNFAARAQSNFVVESKLPRSRAMYRSQVVFERLSAWLRSKGVSARKPIHELRKEFGSQLCEKHGIYAASRMLRHADIAITSQHYTDRPRQATSGLGALLAAVADKKVVQLEQEPAACADRRCSLRHSRDS
jgi:integrase